MYQSMAQYPEDSVLPMAAAFGKMKGEDSALANPIENGQIIEDATPWAKQFAEDLRYWCRAIDDIDAMFAEHDYRFFLVFTNPLLKEAFLRADPTILRAWEQSVMIPHQPFPDTTPTNTSHIPDLVYTCSQCAQSFPTHRQLRTHESMKHDVRCQANLLTPTNCCANCNTIFATRASAIQKLQHSLAKGSCTSHRSHNLKQLQMPTQLHCSLCAAINPTQTTEFSCLAALHQHIKSEHLATLPVSVLPERKFRRKRRRTLTKKTTRRGTAGPSREDDCPN